MLKVPPPLLVINMMGLKNIDAGGIGALVFARVSAELAGAQIQLAGLTNRMRDLLVLTKLITVFDSAAIDKAA
ncbi:MAG: STAS domain-containing protein [Nitrospirota bacterium]